MSLTHTHFDNTPDFFLALSSPKVLHGQIIKTDAGRTGNLKKYTLMAQVSGAKWVPLTAVAYGELAPVDGSVLPAGILISDEITEAAIKAGDVSGAVIAVYGPAEFDAAKLVIENSLTLASVCVDGMSVGAKLRDKGLVARNTLCVTE